MFLSVIEPTKFTISQNLANSLLTVTIDPKVIKSTTRTVFLCLVVLSGSSKEPQECCPPSFMFVHRTSDLIIFSLCTKLFDFRITVSGQ